MPHELPEPKIFIHIESPSCWCCPDVKVLDNGDVLIIHRDASEAN